MTAVTTGSEHLTAPPSAHSWEPASRPVAMLAGVLAAVAAVTTGQLVAALTNPATSPVVAVAAVVIEKTPVWLEQFAIATFGNNDKAILLATIAIMLVIVAAGCGLLARRHEVLAALGVAGIGVVGAAAALTRPLATPAAALASLTGAAVGVAVLLLLIRVGRRRPVPTSSGPATAPTMVLTDRRTVLVTALLVSAFAAVSGGLSSRLGRSRADVDAARAAVRLPAPVDPAVPLPAGVSSGVTGTVPFTVANKDFYRVDTNLVVPIVDVTTWRLDVRGMVSAPFSLTYDDLLAMPLVERDITLTCVSNEVGGQYAGNARWLGVRLADLLSRAGLDPKSDQLVSSSVDGWTCSTPMSVATDGRDALVAIGMNGEPLPVDHGFPARMVVPGLYGFVSATKWLSALEATTYGAQQTYWTQRGWATDAPIRTMTRIEVPQPLSTVSAGRVAIGGTSWAQHRGVDGVEIQIDDGPWKPARLASVPSLDTWHQWSYVWEATAGRHLIRARATDSTGTTQPESRRTPFPSGASGWHEVVVLVS